MKTKYLIGGGLVMLFLALGFGLVSAQSENVVYYACVNNASGTIQMISEEEVCNNNEIHIQWNQVGPQGPQGEAGNLALAGQSCPPYHFLSGFDGEGNILCANNRPGFTPITNNADWQYHIQEFNGVLMALVPAGCLGDDLCFDTPFWIDVYEVTNEQYGSAGEFTDPYRPRDTISWFDAKDFCEARGARLPDEWEWEYAARGPSLLTYPWGDIFVPENTVYWDNRTECWGTCDVGSHPGGVSWVGAQDMSGNVWEWMVNAYDSETKVLRGGSFVSQDPNSIERKSYHPWDPTTNPYNHIGFRCARSY